MSTAPPSIAHPRHLGSLVLAGVLAFATSCATAQVVRTDLDWLHAPLSFYLLGEYGWTVKAAYFALAAAIVLLGVGYYRALARSARSAAPMALFVAGGFALGVTAVADSHTGGANIPLEAVVHGVAASAAFLCVTTAMLLQAWGLRADERWRPRFTLAFGLAAVGFLAMWCHAVWRDAPRGLTQKSVIVLILAWLALAGWWLRNHRDDESPAIAGNAGNGKPPA